MSPSKVICVVRDVAPTPAELEAVKADAVLLQVPCTAEPAEHPDDLHAIVSAWRPDPPAAREVSAWFSAARVDAYLVDERVRIEGEHDWPDGVEAPGIGRLSFVRARPGLSREEMARHWGEVHWPIARVHHPAMWRYVQNVVVEQVTEGAPAIDGIAELRFRSVSDLRERFYDSEAGRQVVADDVAKFLERRAGWRALVRDTWVRS